MFANVRSSYNSYVARLAIGRIAEYWIELPRVGFSTQYKIESLTESFFEA